MRAALDVLATRSTDHAGTPKKADKELALEAVMESLDADESRHQLAISLSREPEPVAQELAALILACTYPVSPKESIDILYRICDHENWEVREYAAGTLGTLLTEHWDDLYPVCLRWVTDPSENIRRAVVLAAKYTARSRKAEWSVPLLDLIEPLLSDRTEYVRKNLGPFAIGDGFLRYYEEETLKRLPVWSRSENEAVLWNVAMTFSASDGAKHLTLALDLLGKLAEDERPFVWRAAASALRTLARKRPQEVTPVLETWLDGPRRQCAERALGKKR